MQILIVQTAFVGDLFLSIPLLKQIPRFFKDAKITLVCRKGLGSFFQQTGLVSVVKEIEKGNRHSYRAVWSELRSKKFQFILCPHRSLRSALFVARIPAEQDKVGYKTFWNFWAFSKTTDYVEPLPDALRQLSLLCLLSEEFSKIYHEQVNKAFYKPLPNSEVIDFRKVSIPDWADMRLPNQLELHDRSVNEDTCFLVPGSVWETKKWTLNGYQYVAQDLIKRGYSVVLLGSHAEHVLCEQIRKVVPDAINLAGQTTLYESVALMQRGKVLVCNDSGAMHLGAAAGLPTVAIFGPTTLDLGFRPWNQQSLVLQKSLACRPCGRHGHKTCPIGTHECMKSIQASEVLEQVDKLTPL